MSKEDCPKFEISAEEPFAPAAMMSWLAGAKINHTDPQRIEEAERKLQQMRQYQKEHRNGINS